ncbi:Uncharacterised protein [Klebsiella pneumoniae]|nr:Uncharacterised protein [Klebsiella pneumoniae]
MQQLVRLSTGKLVSCLNSFHLPLRAGCLSLQICQVISIALQCFLLFVESLKHSVVGLFTCLRAVLFSFTQCADFIRSTFNITVKAR